MSSSSLPQRESFSSSSDKNTKTTLVESARGGSENFSSSESSRSISNTDRYYDNKRYGIGGEGGYRGRSDRYNDHDDDRRNYKDRNYKDRKYKDRKYDDRNYCGRRDYDDRENSYSGGKRFDKYDRYADDDRKNYSDDDQREDRSSSRFRHTQTNIRDDLKRNEHQEDNHRNSNSTSAENEKIDLVDAKMSPEIQQETDGEQVSSEKTISELNRSLKRKMEEHQQKRKKMDQQDKYNIVTDKGDEFIGLMQDDELESRMEDEEKENSIQQVAEQLWTDEKDFILKPKTIDELIELNKVHVLRKEQYEKKLEKLEKRKKKSKNGKKRKHKDEEETVTTTNQEEDVGPKLLPDMTQEKDTRYEVPLLPGEGAAIAEFIQQNKRIPRRGEVGLTSEQITDYENLGYVMSGSRHARMNAIRIMKENEVYMQEEKKRLALLSKQERSQRENKIISQFREIAKRE
ncbi:hypothetical protein FDP41_006578 [Naegleria fowleri]|uniref:NF-kappa-B-activating protein C-terminal domain-containing protein n=1 Tax=Naegleria fowleri TaxID=5763 RepID=A0A6A5BIE3_NAEFO|nr:uncharacterized protein FDP41_006578 [Naegleria fowleri]KAF0974546.1 hypothetical protein FDP41_006578 [Naegleria fowleri]CAG4708216.1 unnamed protein product [Naegleria fowleri]